MNPFYRLAPFIQEYIYRNHWDELRDVQVRAISEIMDKPGHVLIAAGTASGKTEAAFFPILSIMVQKQPDSFGVLYIGPLNALINDQFIRISDLLEEAEFPIYAWHGDRSQSEKARAVKNPKGVLQITPEALEGLLMKHSGEVARMFSELEFIIVDEVHAFMGSDRGLQLQCQLMRIDRLLKRNIRRIGLSATINGYDAAAKWLSVGSMLTTSVIESKTGGRKLQLAMNHYFLSNETAANRQVFLLYYEYIYRQVQGHKSIIFTNSRGDSEQIGNELTRMAEQRGESQRFYVHHGSVAKALRAEAESALRNDEKPAVAVATKTLELGIDLGSLERVVQIGAPNTCSSFVQRLGRTGRRGTPAVMRFVTTSTQTRKADFDNIPWDLLQNIAIVQLYLEERWVEPIETKQRPYSVLFHQLLSALMEKEQTGRELARSILTLPVFAQIPHADSLALMKHMLKTDIIEKTETDTMIPGLKGSRIAEHYTFLSVFADNERWHVISKQQEIGDVDWCPEIDEVIALAGKSWRVTEIDEQHKTVYVVPSKSKMNTKWVSGGGAIHDRIVQRMRQVLLEDTVYSYLLPGAVEALRQARNYGSQYDIENVYTQLSTKRLLLHPWLGTRKMETLYFLLKHEPGNKLEIQDVEWACGRTGLWITTELLPERFVRELYMFMEEMTEEQFVAKVKPLIVDRYDPFIPEALRRQGYVYNCLDITGLREWSEHNLAT